MAVVEFICTAGNVTQAEVDADAVLIAADANADTAVRTFVRGKEVGIEVDGTAPATAVSTVSGSLTGTYVAVPLDTD